MNSIIVACSQCKTRNKVPAVKQHLKPRCGKCKGLLPISDAAVPVEMTDGLLAEMVREASLPLLVDFYSPACGPCRVLAPIINTLARRYFGRLIVGKIDTGANRQSAMQYGIRGVPTLIFFKNGLVVEQIVGAQSEQVLIDKTNNLLGA